MMELIFGLYVTGARLQGDQFVFSTNLSAEPTTMFIVKINAAYIKVDINPVSFLLSSKFKYLLKKFFLL